MGFFELKCLCMLLLLLLFFSVSTSRSSDEVVTVDVHETKGLIGCGHRYLDVRTAEELSKGQLENSINVPYVFFTPQGRVKNPEFVEQVSNICSKDDLILVGCQSGVRSLNATEDLLNAGFKNVKNVGGGYAAWLKNGFSICIPKKWSECSGHSEIIKRVDVHGAKELLSLGHRFLDIRTEYEFKKGHLENALNVPYELFNQQGKVKNPEFVQLVSLVCNKQDHIVLGCQSGESSSQATFELLLAGFKNVKNMEGGYVAWINSGFFVKKLEEDL